MTRRERISLNKKRRLERLQTMREYLNDSLIETPPGIEKGWFSVILLGFFELVVVYVKLVINNSDLIEKTDIDFASLPKLFNIFAFYELNKQLENKLLHILLIYLFQFQFIPLLLSVCLRIPFEHMSLLTYCLVRCFMAVLVNGELVEYFDYHSVPLSTFTLISFSIFPILTFVYTSILFSSFEHKFPHLASQVGTGIRRISPISSTPKLPNLTEIGVGGGRHGLKDKKVE
ncbi:hypothetical protein ADUPG1_005925 [Aduncisulcus paluster]|uniref:Uncharacterized protein n=1 Tax=Aduncisulcus paluster TaxID=2918883 RepID=A0ABQ5KG54_9EUKA|nr:hypothetical protein ADUPG1_005925 [Aduncisulcus paluster]